MTMENWSWSDGIATLIERPEWKIKRGETGYLILNDDDDRFDTHGDAYVNLQDAMETVSKMILLGEDYGLFEVTVTGVFFDRDGNLIARVRRCSSGVGARNERFKFYFLVLVPHLIFDTLKKQVMGFTAGGIANVSTISGHYGYDYQVRDLCDSETLNEKVIVLLSDAGDA